MRAVALGPMPRQYRACGYNLNSCLVLRSSFLAEFESVPIRCVFERKCDPETLNYKRRREGDTGKRRRKEAQMDLSEIHVVDPEGRLLVVSPSLVGLLRARLATVVEPQLVLLVLGTATDTRVGQLEAGSPLSEHASTDHGRASREREGKATVRDGRRSGRGATVEV